MTFASMIKWYNIFFLFLLLCRCLDALALLVKVMAS